MHCLNNPHHIEQAHTSYLVKEPVPKRISKLASLIATRRFDYDIHSQCLSSASRSCERVSKNNHLHARDQLTDQWLPAHQSAQADFMYHFRIPGVPATRVCTHLHIVRAVHLAVPLVARDRIPHLPQHAIQSRTTGKSSRSPLRARRRSPFVASGGDVFAPMTAHARVARPSRFPNLGSHPHSFSVVHRSEGDLRTSAAHV
jgi:hypothetical protein